MMHSFLLLKWRFSNILSIDYSIEVVNWMLLVRDCLVRQKRLILNINDPNDAYELIHKGFIGGRMCYKYYI